MPRPAPPKTLLLATALICVMAPALAGSPNERTGAGNPTAGAVKLLAETCHECHGEDGNSLSPSYPKLAGQFGNYIIKQIHDFQSGARQNATMTIMAQTLTEANLVDIAAHFAASTPAPGEGRDDVVGRTLFTTGDPARDLPACAACHGQDGKGIAASTTLYPSIRGQHSVYLREQLRNWRSGERHNSADGVMNKIAKQLSDAEINALAEYLSSL